MLRNLYLKDFAVVSEAELAFGPQMTAISGETGAGKSLLVDALLLLTGARAEAAMVRHGAERAELAAEFALDDALMAAGWLRNNELDDPDNAQSCQLRRVIRADGGSRAWINGRTATLSQLGELGELLVEIHGQHEHRALLSRAQQLALLDAFGGHLQELDAVRKLTMQLKELQRRLDAHGDASEVEARLEWLDRQLKQFGKNSVEQSDIEELLYAHKRQSNAAHLLEGSARALARLNGEDGPALERSLAQLHVELVRLADHDPAYAQVAELTDAAAIQLAEATNLIERARDGIDLDPDRLQELEDELSRLHELTRRHKVPLEQLASVRDALTAERESLRDAGGDAERLQAERDAAASAWNAAAKTLGAARDAAARKLGKAVTTLMAELGMVGGLMQVALAPTASTEPAQHGTEQAEFLVSANPGQPARPLRKVASGGELSRIALAIEVAALGMDAVPTMVFDEVDSGIGGAVAEVVGRKLRVLGAERQVLCVTHLPQVAAQAHHHVRVSKDSDGTTTRSAVRQLDEAARIDEIARMLGGIEITMETRANAKQMLLKAQVD
ncbi:MAG TPA: DNA repair protein RecN [Xanthomonadaceae bacterium]|nr:DNA repair protein RecN [Xanthomonadaceae bacterium]